MLSRKYFSFFILFFNILENVWYLRGAIHEEMDGLENGISIKGFLRNYEAFGFFGSPKLVLNHGQAWTLCSETNGEFEINNVRPGRYILDVLSYAYTYPSIYIEIERNAVSNSSDASGYYIYAYKYNLNSLQKGERLPLPLILGGLYMLPLDNRTFASYALEFIRNPFVIPGLILLGLFIAMSWIQSNESSEDIKSIIEGFGFSDSEDKEEYKSPFLETMEKLSLKNSCKTNTARSAG